MKNYLSIIGMFCMFWVNAQAPIFHINFNEVSGTGTCKDEVSGIDFRIIHPFSRPERIPANFGQALRLDGYYTFVTNNNFSISDYTNQLTLETWYAADAFTKEPASIIECQSEDGGFQLQVNSFGNLIFSFFINGKRRDLSPFRQLSRYTWHHIVATANGITGEASIYVDGENWLTHTFSANATINAVQSPLWIAKSRLNLRFAGFSLNTLNGAIDEIKIYNQALSQMQVLEHYSEKTVTEADLRIDPQDRFAEDYLRPQYHAMPNTAWTNEAYGLTYYNGKYHLFFQKNPNGPYLYFMHWGHLSSPDLVTWTEEKISLAPSFGFDSFGVWSGTTTFDGAGNPVIFYTGVNGAKAGIGSAYPQDDSLITWIKNRNNPLIPSPPANYFSLDFRDPFIFKRNEVYYMIVGSGLGNNGGGILFTYTSVDLENWVLRNPVFQSRNFMQHGTFWEMPAMFALNEQDYALVITPQFAGAAADVLYWVGSFDGNTFQPYAEEAKRLEFLSKNMLAPAFGQDETDTWSYLGIIPEDRDVSLQVAAGWRHIFSLPRQVRLLKDRKTIASAPHPNLCRLRLDELTVTDKEVAPNSSNNLPAFESNQCELSFQIDFVDAEVITLQVLKSKDGREKTSIILDRQNGRIGLDRRQSSPFPTVKDLRFNDYTFRSTGKTQVRIFLDHSVIEVFIDNLEVFSARVYPSKNSQQIDVLSAGGASLIESFSAYRLGNKEAFYTEVSCPQVDLPDNLYTSTNKVNASNNISVYPNPTSGNIHIFSDQINKITIFDCSGRVRNIFPEGTNYIDISLYEAGIFILKIKNKNGVHFAKIIKK